MSNNKQSSVKWLARKLKDFPHIKHSYQFKELVKQAKAMQQEQAQQYAEFCVVSDREGLLLLDFNSWIAHNETFNTERNGVSYTNNHHKV